MESILMLDTSIASQNRGDEIIMECVRKELSFLLDKNFEYTLPTHVSPFHWYQVWRNSLRLRSYENCRLKFVGGSNILVKDLFTHYPQWNINLFNYRPLKGCILVGVGSGAGNKTNVYTSHIYKHLLSREYYHSVRDERSKHYVESLGLKAINTGCVTMWMLTPEFCKTIPATKARKVVFTLTKGAKDNRDQLLIDTLISNYEEVYFWPQGIDDYSYLHSFDKINSINILPATKAAYDGFLTDFDADYVGTRLHGGVYAMRHGRRAIIIAIDERTREINKSNNLNCIEKDNIHQLSDYINSEFATKIMMNFEAISLWKSQFTQQ